MAGHTYNKVHEESNEFVKKPRQHHVWQEYLRSWAGPDGRVFCLQNGRVFPSGTTVLGMEIDFYKVHTLTEKDIALVKLLASHETHHRIIRENIERFLHYVLAPSILEVRYPESLEDTGVARELDAYKTNVVDEHHTFFERSFLPLLSASLRGDISWYQDGLNRIAFCTYIAAQNLRTRRVKNRAIARVKERGGVDISRVWNILAVVFAFNAGFSMYAEGRPLILVRNQTFIPFLTGDQPVINLNADGETEPKSLSFYYPLSPYLALYFAEPEKPQQIPAVIETADTVTHLNIRLARTCHSQVYASTAEGLEAIKERVARIS